MSPEEARIGTMVRVREGNYTKPELRGLVGTVVQSYGYLDGKVLEVRFGDGRRDLLRYYELENAAKQLSLL